MQTDHQNTHAQDDESEVTKAARREYDDAKTRLSDAAERVKAEAQNAGSTISTLILDELDRRAADFGTQFQSVASRLRGNAGEDQDGEGAAISNALSEQAADLIEDVSSRLQGQSIRDIGQRLGQFGRENPALFVMGCLLTGAMAGRMIVASDTSSGRKSPGQSSGLSGQARSERYGTSQRYDAAGSGNSAGQGTGESAFGDASQRWDQTGSGSTFADSSDGSAAGRPGSGRYE